MNLVLDSKGVKAIRSAKNWLLREVPQASFRLAAARVQELEAAEIVGLGRSG